jgi:8-hydroxy-5-deazaflavin:NADPH oxidoreductase
MFRKDSYLVTNVSIIGTGKMGQAIANVSTKGGHRVELLGKDDPATGDIVVLAVPHSAMHDLLQQRSGSLAGKVVVDISNPVDFATFDSLAVPADSSATAEIAAALPHSHVLKAFNTTFAATLATGKVGPLTTTVLIAGDNTDAKILLADVITTGGLHAIDAGPLRRARELEALGFLQLTLAARELVPWTAGFGLVTSADEPTPGSH